MVGTASNSPDPTGSEASMPGLASGAAPASTALSIALPDSNAAIVGKTEKPVSMATAWVRASGLITEVLLPSELLYCLSSRALRLECSTREPPGRTKTNSFSVFSERSRSTRLVISSSGSA